MKTCKMCHKDKDESEFSKYQSHGKTHLKVWCKPCSSLWYKEYRKQGKKPRGRVFSTKHENEVKRLETKGFSGLLSDLKKRTKS